MKIKSRIDSDVHDIFVKEHLELLQLAKPGNKVMLKGVQCEYMKSVNAYQLIIDSEVIADCKIISNNTETAPKEPHDSLQDSELDKILANAFKMPSTDEESSLEMSNKQASEKQDGCIDNNC